MSADEPVEIGFLKEQKPADDPAPEVDDSDDSLSWLAAAFADDDEPLPAQVPPQPTLSQTIPRRRTKKSLSMNLRQHCLMLKPILVSPLT